MSCTNSTIVCRNITKTEGASGIIDLPPTITDSPSFRQWFGNSPFVDNDGNPVIFFRGETNGVMYDEFDKMRTISGLFFFATVQEHAEFYTPRGEGTEGIRTFYLSAQNVLNLTNIDYLDDRMMGFLNDFASNYEGEIDRITGEEVNIIEMIESGNLYDLEGNGSGDAWYDLFHSAKYAGYDGVIAMDVTDGVQAPVAVVFEPEQIKSTKNRGTFDPKHPNIYL